MYAVEAKSFDISTAVRVSVMVVVMLYFLPAVSQVLGFGVRMRTMMWIRAMMWMGMRYGVTRTDVDVSDCWKGRSFRKVARWLVTYVFLRRLNKTCY